jgi:hypothetical protein
MPSSRNLKIANRKYLGGIMRRTATALSIAVLLLCLAAAPTTQTSDRKSDAQPTAKPAVQREGKQEGQAIPRAALSKKIPEIRFAQLPLADAIDYLRDVTGANIHVNWRAIELINVTRQTPVSVTLTDVPMRRVLKSVLDETGGGELLTWYVEEGVIEITTKEIADNQMVTRVYPVQDLVAEVPNFVGPNFNLQSQSNTASGGGGGGGSSSGLFSGSNTTTPDEQKTPQQRTDDLVKTIQSTVRPDVWRDNGGTASIRYFNGHLIVTAPRSVQEAISGKPE